MRVAEGVPEWCPTSRGVLGCWPALRQAARLGLDMRIGLEDTLEMPDGSLAPDNAALVAAARALISAIKGM
jgi:uncharacterized protein (DUF849 family)